MAVSLTGRYTVARYRAGPAGAKGGALRRLRPATEPQLIVVSESGNPHGLTLVILLRQRTGAGRGIRRGKREERNVRIIKNNKRIKNIKYRLTG